MELKIRTKENAESGATKLPAQFEELVRADLIKKAVLAVQANNRQRYGLKPGAGMRHSAKVSRRRRKYRGAYGQGISRVPRKVLSRSGTRFNWVGAEAPGTVGGRRAHGPKAEKIFAVKLNDKERRKAIRSALAATVSSEVVSARGHSVPTTYPFVLGADFDAVEKTAEMSKAFKELGFTDEMIRAAKKTVRAGKGKARNRKYKKRVGPVVVVSSDSKMLKSVKNLAGFDVVKVTDLNAEILAPGCQPGRAALFTEKALAEMAEKKLFM